MIIKKQIIILEWFLNKYNVTAEVTVAKNSALPLYEYILSTFETILK